VRPHVKVQNSNAAPQFSDDGELRSGKFCPWCGSVNAASDVTCRNCGESFSDLTSAAPEGAELRRKRGVSRRRFDFAQLLSSPLRVLAFATVIVLVFVGYAVVMISVFFRNQTAFGSKQIASTAAVYSPILSPYSSDTPCFQVLPAQANLVAYNVRDNSIPGRMQIVLADSNWGMRCTLTNYGFHDPAWSADGKHLVFVSDSPQAVYLIARDGSTPHVLAATTTGQFDHPLWSPDGKHLALAANDLDDAGYNLYVMNADGTSLQKLTGDRETWTVLLLAWLPNSEEIVYQQTSQQNGVPLDKRCTTFILSIDYPENAQPWFADGNCITSMAWSPDGKRIAYLANNIADIVNQSGPTFNQGLFLRVMDADKSNDKTLFAPTSEPIVDTKLTWSADSISIAFVRNNSYNSTLPDQVWSVNADGSNLHALSTTESGKVSGLAWEPAQP